MQILPRGGGEIKQVSPFPPRNEVERVVAKCARAKADERVVPCTLLKRRESPELAPDFHLIGSLKEADHGIHLEEAVKICTRKWLKMRDLVKKWTKTMEMDGVLFLEQNKTNVNGPIQEKSCLYCQFKYSCECYKRAVFFSILSKLEKCAVDNRVLEEFGAWLQEVIQFAEVVLRRIPGPSSTSRGQSPKGFEDASVLKLNVEKPNI
ncbi:hypothetical protein Trydic_g10621 [Trypoxylus dichotomus]